MEQTLNEDVYMICDKLDDIINKLNYLYNKHFYYDCSYMEIISKNITKEVYTCIFNYNGKNKKCIFKLYYYKDSQIIKFKLFKHNKRGDTNIYENEIESEIDLNTFLNFTLLTITMLIKLDILD